jgi:hypothetical protein
MKDRRRSDALPGLLAVLLTSGALVAPVAATAQSPLDFELRGGMGLPAFDLADRTDAGPAVGLDLAYRVAPGLSVVVGGDVEFLDGQEPEGTGPGSPGVNAWHYGGGLEAQLLRPTSTYWRLNVGAGLGATTFDVSEGGGSETDLSVYGSLELGWNASEEMELFVGLRSYLAFAGDDAATPTGDGEQLQTFADAETLWSFPVMGGVRLLF